VRARVPQLGRGLSGLPGYMLPLAIDPAALRMVLGVLTGWLDCREREAVAYLVEENRLLRRQLGAPVIDRTRRVRRKPRLGGLLNFYERAA
jgi:hypothetical protein